MTIGRNNEAPAVYALSDIIKRLLLHLAEAVLYSAKDLDHIADTLINLRDIVKNAESKNEPNFLTLRLSNRLELCHTSCHELQQSLNRLDPSLQVLHEKLISILRLISLANTKTNVCQGHPIFPSMLLISEIVFIDRGQKIPRATARSRYTARSRWKLRWCRRKHTGRKRRSWWTASKMLTMVWDGSGAVN